MQLGADRIGRMEQIIDSFANAKQFMGEVLVAEDGRAVLDKSYGFANVEWQVPNTPESKFRLGSITKQFTAASILLLEQQGKLSTDDLVKKYMPDAPAAWDKITIYQVLTHTSGIPSFTGFPDYHANEVKPYTPEQLVAWCAGRVLQREQQGDVPDAAPERARYQSDEAVGAKWTTSQPDGHTPSPFTAPKNAV
jgi:CubicO group peptidase (beta-lactamase class C family)